MGVMCSLLRVHWKVHFVLQWWKCALGLDIVLQNCAKVIPYLLKVVHSFLSHR